MSTASVIVKVGAASVVFPALGFVCGLLLQIVIPGCHCDEGGGCGGCGPLNHILGTLIFGGFVGAIAAIILILPVSLVLAGIVGFLERKFASNSTDDSSGKQDK